MKIMKLLRVLFIIVGILIILAGLVVWRFWPFFRKHLPSVKHKAIQRACEYLRNKYSQNMIFQKIYGNFFEYNYSACFVPENNPDLQFIVYVSVDATSCSDDYYKKSFEWEMNKCFLPDVKEIWGVDASLYTFINIKNIESSIPGLTERTHVDEIKQYIADRYSFSVRTNKAWLNDEANTNAQDILRFFQIVKQKGNRPSTIQIHYPEYNPKEQKRGMSLSFDDWEEIQTVEQILQRLRGG